MKIDEQNLSFKKEKDKYILIPENELSIIAQEKAFLLFENMQLLDLNQ